MTIGRRKELILLSLRIIGAAAVGVCAMYSAWQLRSITTFGIFTNLIARSTMLNFWEFFPVIAIVQPGVMYFLKNHRLTIRHNFSYVIINILFATLLITMALVVFAYFIGQVIWSQRDALAFRSVLVIFTLNNVVFLTIWSFILSMISGVPRKNNVLLVGTGPIADDIINEIENDRWLGMRIIGIVTLSARSHSKKYKDYPILGSIKDIPKLAKKYTFNEILIIPKGSWQDTLIDAISEAERINTRIMVVPSIYDILIGQLREVRIRDIPLMEFLREPDDLFYRAYTRITNIITAIILLLCTLPLWIIIAVLIKLDSPGPIFYTQTRVGRKQKLFDIIKFRTMRADAEKTSGAVMSSKNDPRITRIGRVLRVLRLDELPQLINIIKGEMNFLGPRPERPKFVAQFKKSVKGYSERFKIKPGLTGLAQTHGNYTTSPENKLKYDLAYIYNHSFWLDMLIIFETIKTVITRQGT